MRVKEAQIARALDRADSTVRLFMLYGPDEAGSRALAMRLERALGPDAERIDLDGAILKDDPARLADEAAAFSLFGGKRHIRVTGGEECANAVTALLDAPSPGNPVVLIAGALKPAGALLKTVADRPDVMACISYKPEGSDADALAETMARARGVRLSRAVATTIAANCLGDRAVLEQEIEKLALYLDAAPDRPREADDAVFDAIGAGLSLADTGKLVNAVLGGDLVAATQALQEIDARNEWVPATRAVQRRLVLLARLRSQVDAGKSPHAAVSALGKALFYAEHPAVTTQLARWPSAKIATASARLFAAEGATMASGTAGDMIAAQELIAITRVAQSLR